ncbi:MAG: hypothetical protein IPJ65_39135 [Archangiaceae bacterium]|nr:hypothetical protein [Archangiaceae bacterium]
MRTALIVTAACLLAACNGGATLDYKSTLDGRPDVLDPSLNPDHPAFVGACDFGYSYDGFGGTRLEAGREDEEVGYDRDRVKPYEALAGEYARVLGKPAPALLGQLSSTFGSTPARWFVEPAATAVSMYSAMRVAFVGCLDFTNSAEFDQAPNQDSATAKCAAFARRFWNRTADVDEVQACVDVAVSGTNSESQPRRKWAYACSAVLSSAPFLTF